METQVVSAEGILVLEVKLIKPREDEVTAIEAEDGVTKYRYKDADLPPSYSPGCNLLSSFQFTWDGKVMPISEEYYSDLTGLDIQSCNLILGEVEPEFFQHAEDFFNSMRHPRVDLSADGGTALIEWERLEGYDAISTIRWIISESGTVLRHRLEIGPGC